MEQRYFFTQDESSHWYMIPVELKEVWDRLAHLDDCWEYDAWRQIEEHRLGGGINDITFEKPSNI